MNAHTLADRFVALRTGLGVCLLLRLNYDSSPAINFLGMQRSKEDRLIRNTSTQPPTNSHIHIRIHDGRKDMHPYISARHAVI